MTFMRERRGQVSVQEADAPSAALSPCGTQHVISFGGHSIRLPARTEMEQGPVYETTKRATDVVAASSLLFLLFPVFLMVATLIYLEDRGPIFYYQTRVGKKGRRFRFFKFRSMVQEADIIKANLQEQNEAKGPIFKMRNDPRITRIGRFIRRYSIDELPQLVNVLRGEMSLVGPRPHLPSEVERYNEKQSKRLEVQPGLICFREVLGRSNMTFEQWVELDLLYIEHRSWSTDGTILVRLIPAVLSADGAY
jgi:lipopolysaccharide/colanic/teichoic acid biosynthesis glycosyltransferase